LPNDEYKELENFLNELVAYTLTDVGYFIPFCHSDYQYPLHLQSLVDICNDIINGNVRRFTMHVPPQHGKSELLLHSIALYLKKNPTKNVAYVGYAQQFSERQTRKAYKYMKKLGLAPVIEKTNEFILAEGGGLFTSSVTGILTGETVDWLIIDDPFASPLQAYSKTYRERIWDWWLGVAKDRERPETSVTVLHTRWHLDDLIGRLIKNKERFEHYRLPALYDGLDAYGKPCEHTKDMDTPLWRDYEFYNEKRLAHKPTFLAKFQGLPIVKGDAVFKDVNYYSELPKEYKYQIGSDFAYSENSKSDYSVFVVFAVANKKYYLVDVIRYQKEISYTKSVCERLKDKYKTKIGIESNGTQKAVYDMLKTQIKGNYFYPVIPSGDKLTRSIPFASEWNLGNVLLPDPTVFNHSWLEDYIDEITSFTGVKDSHDDQVDASVMAFINKGSSIGVMIAI